VVVSKHGLSDMASRRSSRSSWVDEHDGPREDDENRSE
jgi:hypothetical protein